MIAVNEKLNKGKEGGEAVLKSVKSYPRYTC